ncbi:DEAD-domain-containing protein [Trametes coccinea BRFM310]|uniref:ATP-dependent RNA helicase n=1 Tax=Trametes coccinea (strain BRFM310) TaxID=1353009 RepID=A0A1Y2J5P9_TRAC3|nr:DEAD-domain-containing protein [Trametes coccinea BRFM310]
MAASLWTKSVALLPAARICRCSSAALAVHALRAGRFSSVRYASAAALKESREYTTSHDAAREASTSSRPRHDVDANEEQASDTAEEQVPFDSLEGKVSPAVLRALTKDSFRLTHMTPVQAAVLPLLPDLVEPYDPENPPAGPRDLLVKARTGTGKTLGFLIPAVESRLKRIRQHAESVTKELPSANRVTISRAVEQFARKNVGALIISPTRELATQIANEAIKLTRSLDRFEVRLAVGGLPKRPQLREWNLGRRDIIVATPGRLRDFIENEPGFKDALQTTDIFILDEADTLLEMGFREDIEAIARELKPAPERQTFMFSATVSKAIEQIARATLDKNHVFLNCVPENAAPTHLSIPQFYTAVPSPKEQLPHILRLIAEDQLMNPGKSKVLVFFPTTSMTKLYSAIINDVAPVMLPAGSNTHFGELHGKKQMATRVRTSDWFRQYSHGNAVMLTSDVSARGVDYPNVTRVIQVGAPNSADTYVHRVGRTGRGSNKQGRADLVIMPWELGFLTWQMKDIPLKELPVNKLKEDVVALAKKYDEDPEAFTKDRRARFRGGPVAERLENVDDAIARTLHGRVDSMDIRDMIVALLRYYQANYSTLRVAPGVAADGVHEWAAALAGEDIDLRIPSDLLRNENRRRGNDRQNRSYRRDGGGFSNDRNDRRNSFSRRDRDDDGGYRGFSKRDRDGGDRDGGYRSFSRRDHDGEDGERRSFSRRDRDGEDGGERRSFSRRDRDDEDGGDRPKRAFSRPASGNRWEGRGSHAVRRDQARSRREAQGMSAYYD